MKRFIRALRCHRQSQYSQGDCIVNERVFTHPRSQAAVGEDCIRLDADNLCEAKIQLFRDQAKPLIQPSPGTAADLNVATQEQRRNCAQLRAPRVRYERGDNVRDAEPADERGGRGDSDRKCVRRRQQNIEPEQPCTDDEPGGTLAPIQRMPVG